MPVFSGFYGNIRNQLVVPNMVVNTRAGGTRSTVRAGSKFAGAYSKYGGGGYGGGRYGRRQSPAGNAPPFGRANFSGLRRRGRTSSYPRVPSYQSGGLGGRSGRYNPKIRSQYRGTATGRGYSRKLRGVSRSGAGFGRVQGLQRKRGQTRTRGVGVGVKTRPQFHGYGPVAMRRGRRR